MAVEKNTFVFILLNIPTLYASQASQQISTAKPNAIKQVQQTMTTTTANKEGNKEEISRAIKCPYCTKKIEITSKDGYNFCDKCNYGFCLKCLTNYRASNHICSENSSKKPTLQSSDKKQNPPVRALRALLSVMPYHYVEELSYL